MKTRLIELLQDLASIDFQRKYIVNGTKDEYLLPQDLLSDIENATGDHLQREPYRKNLSKAECELLEKLYSELQKPELHKAIHSDHVTNAELIEENPYWARIRDVAKEILLQAES